ncbi:MAG: hypothetical protein ACPF9K_07895, partial [Neptuniibacter sp.]
RAIAGKVYEIQTVVEFMPKPNHKYVVKGELSETNSVIWIESITEPGVIIGKHEVKGSTSLGLLSK